MGNMGNLINIKGKYSNRDAVDNVIRYITRTRKDEMRRGDLQGYGGAGVGCYACPQTMAARLKAVQKLHGIEYRGGRRILHEVFSITDGEFKEMGCDMASVGRLALELCMEYFNMGFQTVYAVHWERGKGLHIHFAVNAVSYVTGRKINTSWEGNWHREHRFNDILRSYCCGDSPFTDDGAEGWQHSDDASGGIRDRLQ